MAVERHEVTDSANDGADGRIGSVVGEVEAVANIAGETEHPLGDIVVCRKLAGNISKQVVRGYQHVGQITACVWSGNLQQLLGMRGVDVMLVNQGTAVQSPLAVRDNIEFLDAIHVAEQAELAFQQNAIVVRAVVHGGGGEFAGDAPDFADDVAHFVHGAGTIRCPTMYKKYRQWGGDFNGLAILIQIPAREFIGRIDDDFKMVFTNAAR